MEGRSKVRLQLVPNTGQKSRGLPVVVEGPTFAAIAQAARNKLLARGGGGAAHKAKRGPKKGAAGGGGTLRLFLQDGRELLPVGGDPDQLLPLKQDTVLVVSSGEAFVSSAGRLFEDPAPPPRRTDAAAVAAGSAPGSSSLGQLVASLLEQLPSLPVPVVADDDPALEEDAVDGDDIAESQGTEREQDEAAVEDAYAAAAAEGATTAAAAAAATLKKASVMATFDFDGPFPVMEGNVLPLLREAIKDCDDFVVANGGDFLAFDYRRVTRDTFPDPAHVPKKNARLRWLMAARRECRGLLVSQATGCVLARRFHKFFNVDERPECAADLIPLTDSVVLTEKIDGCLVSPVLASAERVLWVTKVQPSQKIEEFVTAAVAAVGADYRGLAVECAAQGLTPLFEWCDPSLGVIVHRTQSLVLLATRHNVTGRYLDRSALESTAARFRVPVAARLSLDLHETPTAASLKARVDAWAPGTEGLVMTLPESGLMYKLKSHWYRTLHVNSGIANLAKVLAERPSLNGVPPAMIWSAVVSGRVDDLLPLLRAARNDADADLLSSLVTAHHVGQARLLKRLQAWGVRVKQLIRDRVAEAPQPEAAGAAQQQYDKVEDLVLQQLALKLAGSLGAFLAQHWTKRSLQYFVKPEPVDRQERAVDEMVRRLAARGKWRQLEAILGLSWQRSFDAGTPAGPLFDQAEGNAAQELAGEHDDDYDDNRSAAAGEASAPLQLQVFCDLDDVLVDFTGGIRRIGRTQAADGSPQMWALIRKHKTFWSGLDKTEGADALWDYLSSQPHGSVFPKILTGVPEGKMGLVAREQKLAWCRRHLPTAGGGDPVEVIACQSSKKYEYSRFGHVLIDDRETMRAEWERMGGTFVLHTDMASTLAQLQTLLPELSEQLGAVRELIAAGQRQASTTQTLDVFNVTEETISLVEGERGLAEFIEAMASARVVGLDVEWTPDTPGAAQNRAALLQVAVSEDRVFLVDLLCLHRDAERAVVQMLEAASVLKLGFGLQEDVYRLGLEFDAARATLDLAQVVPALVPGFAAAPSLGRVVERLLGVRLQKSKLLQAFDWSLRPLPVTHRQYAAADAACLLRLHTAITQHPALRALVNAAFTIDLDPPSKRQRQQYQSAAAKPGGASTGARVSKQRVTLQYTAVFLHPDSRDRLLASFPALLPTIHADHVTLAYAPSMDSINGLPVGEEATVRVLGHAADGNAQAVAVELTGAAAGGVVPTANAILHVTIATRPGVPMSYANELLARGFVAVPDQTTLELSGVIGLVVANEFVMAELPPKILSEMREFAASGLPGQCLELGKKQPLTAMERQAVHKFAEDHGMESESTGRKHQRVVTLRIPHRLRRDEQPDGGVVHDLRIMKSGNEDENKRLMRQNARSRQKAGEAPHIIRVTDDATLQSLQLVFKSLEEADGGSNSSSVRSVGVHGRLRADGMVKLDPSFHLLVADDRSGRHELALSLLSGERDPDATPTVVIIRGLPGSGKSSLVRALVKSVGAGSAEDREHDNDSEATSAVCSADEFWERGAGRSKRELKRMQADEGLTTDDIYDRCWDERRLGEAHEYCFTSFRAALESGRRLVIVDNVNAHLRDYAAYATAAVAAGYAVLKLEIVCGGDHDLAAFHRRCRHRVPMAAMAATWRRWETEPEAILLLPFLGVAGGDEDDDEASSNSNHLTRDAMDDNGQSLLQWFSRNKLFGARTKHRRPSHMMAELEDRPSKFIFVPEELHDEFLRRYAADSSPKFLIEHFSVPVCPLHFDVDYLAECEMSPELQFDIVRSLQRTVRTFYPDRDPSDAIFGGVVVTGGACYQHCGPIKSGRHVTFPDVLVSAERAACIAEAAAARLEAEQVGRGGGPRQPSWGQMLDTAIYRGGEPGVRMFGSRKTCRNVARDQWVDAGIGVHTLRAVVDVRGEPDDRAFAAFLQDPVALLKATTLRSWAKEPTPGFRAPVGPGLPQGNAAPAQPQRQGVVSVTTLALDDIELTPARYDLAEHVVERYLPRKLANFLGLPLREINDETLIELAREHGPSEGKIRGMWEQFAKTGVIDLRVDLQPRRREGRTSHYGDDEFANWQVQFGASQVCKASSRARPGQTDASGAFAGVFMRTGVPFRVGDLKQAMALSFDQRSYVCLDRVAVDDTAFNADADAAVLKGVRMAAPVTDKVAIENEDEEDENEDEGEDDDDDEDEDEDEDEGGEEADTTKRKAFGRKGKGNKTHARKEKRLAKHQLHGAL